MARRSPARAAHNEGHFDARDAELQRLAGMATFAQGLGLEVHAGHGLTYDTVAPVAAIPELAELNIGHFLIGEAIFSGLDSAIRRMRELMDRAGAWKAWPRHGRFREPRMNPRSLAYLLTALACLASQSSAAEQAAPEDFCIVPVECGPQGGSCAGWRTTSDAAYFPGLPTPIFLGSSGTVRYFDTDGFLPAHPDPAPNFLDDFFLGESGNIYFFRGFDGAKPQVLDRSIRHFRPVLESETVLWQESLGLWEANRQFGSARDNPARIKWRVRPETYPDVDLLQVPGAWRLDRLPKIIPLSDPDQALIATSSALYWLRNQRRDGPEICGALDPPPIAEVTSFYPNGVSQLVTENPRIGGFWSIRGGEAVLIHARSGLFELRRDGAIHRIEGVPDLNFHIGYRVPGSETIVISASRSFVLVEDGVVTFESADLKAACCLTVIPYGTDSETGDILLYDNWRLGRDGSFARDPSLEPRRHPPARQFDDLERWPNGAPVATPDGRLYFMPDGRIYDASCGTEFKCGVGSTLAIASGDGLILVAATIGLFRLDPENRLMHRIVPNTTVGSVWRVQFVPWESEFLVEAAYGYFLWSEINGLRLISSIEGRYPYPSLTVVEEAERIIVEEVPPRFLELGGR